MYLKRFENDDVYLNIPKPICLIFLIYTSQELKYKLKNSPIIVDDNKLQLFFKYYYC